MSALDSVADWPVRTVAAVVVLPSGVLAQHGDSRHRFALASVSKPLMARAAQIAVEEGVVELGGRPAGFDGAASARARVASRRGVDG